MNLYVKSTWTDFLGWTKLEYAWLFVCTAAIAATSILMKNSVLEFISSVTGIVGAILVAKGKISSYWWGVIATALYAWISYKYQLFGEAIMYTLVFLPMQVWGAVVWSSKLNVSGDRADVIKNYLTTKQRIWVSVGTLVAIALYALFVAELKGSMPGLDSATAILSILATTLMMYRYAEQWIVWLLVNIVAVVMWIQATMHHEGGGAVVLAMWVAYLLNSLFGVYQWRKQNK
ncbi:nicotinamide riboside transporter [Klebsiella phage KP13-26]|nr:nicotinamide riboside transporter [Klebsiella phage KP13-26]